MIISILLIGRKMYEWEEHKPIENAVSSFIEKTLCFDDGCYATVKVMRKGLSTCNEPVCDVVRKRYDKVEAIVTVEVGNNDRKAILVLAIPENT